MALKGWLGRFADKGGRSRTLGPGEGREISMGKNSMEWIESIEVDMESLEGELRKKSDDGVVVLHVVDT